MSALSDYAGRSPSSFSMLASNSLVLVLDPQKAVMETARVCATGRYTLVQNQTTFSASHVQVLGSPLSYDFKNEVLSIISREALAEKQPRSRKELSMLYIGEQLCHVSWRTHSLAVNSKGEAKVGVIAVHSLRVTCLAPHHGETVPQHNSS